MRGIFRLSCPEKDAILKALALLVEVKRALWLDPLLLGNPSVTKQIGNLNDISQILRDHVTEPHA
jgi:hypothetical protein